MILIFVALALGVRAQGDAADDPESVLRELRAAAAGEVELDGSRLDELYGLLAAWEADAPDDEPAPGVPWSEPLALLDGEISKRADRRTLNVWSSRVLGERLDREGRRDEAIAHLEGAWLRLKDDPYAAYLRVTLGEILRDEHRFADAMVELRAARDRIFELRATRGGELHAPTLDLIEAMATLELGAATEQLGMVDVAEPLLREAERLARSLDERSGPATWGAALVYELNLAFDHRPEGGVELRARFEASPWRDLVPPETAAQIAVRLATIDVRRAFLGEATPGSGAEELRAAIRGGLKINEEISSRLHLATSYLDNGEHALAREEIEIVRAKLGEDTGRELLRLKLLAAEARALRTQPALADERARLLADELRPGMDSELARMLEWPIEASGVAPLGLEHAQIAFGELVRYELDVEAGGGGAERALAWLLRLQAAGTFACREGIDAPSLDELRRALTSDGALVLAWLPGRETTQLFALDASGVDVHPLPGVWSLQRDARALSERLLAALQRPSEHSDARLAAAAAAASRAFLPDELRERLAAHRTVRVTGLEAFGYVPLEALPTPAQRADGWEAKAAPWEHVLGRSHAVAYLPSLPVGVRLAERAAAMPVGTDSAPAAAGFVAHGRRDDLKPLAVEPADIGIDAYGARAFAAGALDDLLGALGDVRVAHLFCHGQYDESRVLPAGLVLDPAAEDGVWYAEDVERRAWPPVVLVSACGSARAPLRRGDDGTGTLRSAFYRGGAVVVAGATMPLEERAAAELGRLVHAELARGATLGEAFLAARRGASPARLGVHPAHSYLWHVVGIDAVRAVDPAHAQGPAEKSPARRALPFALALGVLAVGAAALRLRRGSARTAA